MKKIVLAGALVALMVPVAGFAQEADNPSKSGGVMPAPTGALIQEGTNSNLDAPAKTGAQGMSNDAMGMAQEETTGSTTTDPTGNYTIVRRMVGQSLAGSTENSSAGSAPNLNTDPAAIRRTVDANPGLEAKLNAEGIMVDTIASISVEPNGQVVVYTSGS